ncbi:MAG TPA: glycosyltransferase family 39 protein, partial [Verrucomicrobium sp.]|nr:glycosyltransferase family 39 protein [Verrucomicrobium sp.]
MPRLRSLLTPANFFRVVLLIVCIQAVGHLRDEKPPWKSAWGRHRAEGVDPSFREHLATGLWAGAVARLGFGATLLVLSLAWGRQGSSPAAKGQSGDVIVPSHRPLGAALSAPTCPSPLLYYSLLGALLAGALAMRLPRLTHSFWGDEEDSMATYIHGMYKPTKKKDRQGAVYFEPPLWAQTFYSARHGPNNHVLFSVTSRLSLEAWRKLTKHKNTEFTEWVARLPSLVAGLASLAGLALLLRRWGVPWLGLLAALFMAIHPWHVRYSVEARGYALALAFYPFLLIALTNALDFGRWRSWLAYGLFQFLIMYSWAGSAYLLVMLNLVVAVMALRSQQRWPQLVRWTTVNLAAAGAFISLYAPHVPQIIEAKKRLLWLKGLPMDAAWFHNLLAEPFSGIPYHKGDVTNPGEISWQGLWSESPALTSAGFSLVLLAFLAGLPRLWRHHRGQACLVFSAFVAAIV